MESAKVAELLALGIEGPWDDLAELAKPGTGAHIAHVRAGTGSTTKVPAAFAARLVTELDDLTVVVGDTRDAVQSALQQAGSKPASPKPNRTVTAMFAGDAATISERLGERSSPLGDTHITAWLALDADLRRATGPAMLRSCAPRQAAAVWIDAAVTNGAEGGAALAGDFLDALRMWHPDPRDSHERHKATARAQLGLISALHAWLGTHHGGGTVCAPGQDPPRLVDVEAPAAAGDGLAAAAGTLAAFFAGPRHLAEIAIDAAVARRAACPTQALNWTVVIGTAAASGCDWNWTRDRLVDGPLNADTLANYARCAGVYSADFAAQILRVEAPSMPTNRGHSQHLGELLKLCGHRLTVSETLDVCMALAGPDSLGHSYWTYATVGYLIGQHGDAPTADQLRTAAAANPRLDAHLDAVADALVLHGTPAEPATPDSALEVIWEKAVANAAVARVLEAIRHVDRKPLARRWVRLVEAHVNAELGAGVDRASIWAAVTALAPGFAGTTRELISVASTMAR